MVSRKVAYNQKKNPVVFIVKLLGDLDLGDEPEELLATCHAWGLGEPLTWKNLPHYRTVQARATRAVFRSLVIQSHGIQTVCGPVADQNLVDMVMASWMIAHAPIVLRDLMEGSRDPDRMDLDRSLAHCKDQIEKGQPFWNHW